MRLWLYSYFYLSFLTRTPAFLASLATAHDNHEPTNHVFMAHHPRCPPRPHRGDGHHASIFRPTVSIRSSPRQCHLFFLSFSLIHCPTSRIIPPSLLPADPHWNTTRTRRSPLQTLGRFEMRWYIVLSLLSSICIASEQAFQKRILLSPNVSSSALPSADIY